MHFLRSPSAARSLPQHRCPAQAVSQESFVAEVKTSVRLIERVQSLFVQKFANFCQVYQVVK